MLKTVESDTVPLRHVVLVNAKLAVLRFESDIADKREADLAH